MTKKNRLEVSKKIIEYVGGKENISYSTHCITRLRFNVKDKGLIKISELEQLEGVAGVQWSGDQLQVIIGSDVEDYYKEVAKLIGNNSKEEDTKDVSSNGLISIVSAIFTPILGVLCGSGLIKGILTLLTTFGVMAADSTTYVVLYAVADAIFYFMPIAVAITSARKFGANQFLAFAIGAALVYPTIIDLSNAGAGLNFMGIPLQTLNYSSTVLPAIFSVYLLSVVEKLITKFTPKFLRTFLVPALCMVIVLPISLLIVGPVVTIFANGMSSVYKAIYGFSPLIAGAFMGGLWQCFVMFGVHWAFIPIIFGNYVTFGFDTITAVVAPATFTQAGATLGVLLRSKDKDTKQIAFSATISALFGITEPAMHGITLKSKMTFIIAAVCAAIGGAFIGVFGCASSVFALPSLLTLPAFLNTNFTAFLIGCFGSLGLTTLIVYLIGYKEEI